MMQYSKLFQYKKNYLLPFICWNSQNQNYLQGEIMLSENKGEFSLKVYELILFVQEL